MIYRSYGKRTIIKNYSYDRSEERRARELSRNKPCGCLWASPVNAGGYTWKNFCIDASYGLESLKEYVDFTLSKNTKILIIKNDRDLIRVAEKYGFINNGLFYFNWKTIESEYDACYIRISNITRNLLWKYHLLSWDVDSLCVFNLKKVVVR